MRLYFILYFIFAPFTIAKTQDGVTDVLSSKQAPVIESNVSFDKNITLFDKMFSLKGTALRKKLIFNVYVIGLYLLGDARDALDVKTSRALRLVLKRTISMKDMIDALDDGIKKNTSNEAFQNTQAARNKFKLLFQEGDFKEGAELILAYAPEKGLHVKINGALKGTIEDPVFAQAIFAVWLGNNPVTNDMKKKLLGL